MNTLVRFERDQDVAVITIDNPPVNALSSGVVEGLKAAIERANADAEVRAIVVIGSGRTFIAGADVHEFQKPTASEYVARIRACLVDNRRFRKAGSDGDSRRGVGRWSGNGDGRALSLDRAVGSGGTAGSEAGSDSGRGRHAAIATIGGCGEGGGDVRVWRSGQSARGACRWESSTGSSTAICARVRWSSRVRSRPSRSKNSRSQRKTC